MQKYVLVTFLHPIKDGSEFVVGHWPLHMTLVANFALDREATGLEANLADLFAHNQPLETFATHDDHFGPGGQVHVTRLQLTPELASLHNQTVALLKNCGAVFDEPRYLESGYKPHVTVQSDDRITKDDQVAIAAVSLVDMFPNNDLRGRRVLRTFRLGVNA